MAKTSVVCPHCKEIFRSPIAFGDRRAFETATLSGNILHCPKCRKVVPCNKENMIFSEDK